MNPEAVALSLVGLLLALLTIGFVRIRLRYNEIGERLILANEFLQRFQRVVTSASLPADDYAWLLRHQARLQGYVDQRVSYSYRPPFANHMIHNYQLIVNTIPHIRTGQAHSNDIASVEDVLIMVIGHLQTGHEALGRGLRNPWHWFSIGLTAVLEAPIRALAGVGIIGDDAASRANDSKLYKLVAFLAFLITILAGLMEIAQGWDEVVGLLRRWR